jgi:hypothetical protein
MFRAAILAGVIGAATACGPETVTVSSTSPSSTPSQSSATTGATTQAANPMPMRISGSVSGLSGSCPTLAFTVSATTITTSSDTTFDRGGCSAVANGATVTVSGLRQSDGSILARHVLLDEGAK